MKDFYPKINLTGYVQNNIPDMGIKHISPAKLESMDEQSVGFKDVMSGLASNLNEELNAPDALLKKAMSGSSDVDVHDVMTAMAKAELTISVATQITSKVIQAYDKIMQISV